MNAVENCVSVFLHFSGSRKFPRTFLAHSLHIWRSGQVPIVTKLMQFTLCKTREHLYNKIQFTLSLPSQAAREKYEKEDILAAAFDGTTMRSHTNDRVRNLLKEPPLCVLHSSNKVAKKLHPALFTKVPLWIGGW